MAQQEDTSSAARKSGVLRNLAAALVLSAAAFLAWGMLMRGAAENRASPRTEAAKSSSKKSWHYRMTVIVKTPEGLISGSTVREVSYEAGIHLLPEMQPHIEYRGEAVVVDLGARGILFALLSGDYASDILLRVFNKDGSQELRPSQVPEKGKVNINPDAYPLFAHFKDINDPKTIETIHDTEQIEKWERRGGNFNFNMTTMEKAFGEGVKIKDVVIEITKDPITLGEVDKYLPWFSERYTFVLKRDFVKEK